MKDRFENKHSLTTDVILVVKGAGEQKLDATLNSFLNGFLEAVRGYDPDAVVNIGPESKIFQDYNYTPSFKDEDFEQNIVEVLLEYKGENNQKGSIETKNTEGDEKREDKEDASSKKANSDEQERKEGDKKSDPFRRIWIKEAYWEPKLGLPGAFSSLLHEWRLSSYALIKLFEKLFFPWQDDSEINEEFFEEDNDTGGKRENEKDPRHSFWAYLLYYLLANVVIFLFLSFIGVWGNPFLQSVLKIPRNLSSINPFFTSPINYVSILLGLAVLTSLASARKASGNRDIQIKKGLLPRMPGLSNWLLIGLVSALFLEPVAYISWLLIYALILLISNLLARRIAWNQRADFYTDAPLHFKPDKKKKLLYRRPSRISLISQLLYRVLVTIALPIAVTLLTLSKVFLILNIFGDLGTRINIFLNNLIVQTFGDVTAYAIDPAAAARVQNLVEEEIRSFSKLTLRSLEENPHPEDYAVYNIHVFAHSQGTPITFEVLFHKLEEDYLKKINTYVTIGSVLNLHHLVNEVLDDNFWNRFPPVRPSDTKGSFRWFNFWNFTDPITQFTGLEAYRQEALWIKKDSTVGKYRDGSPRIRYANVSPFSIKTRESIFRNHSEYWTNVTEIHSPFIERIFYKPDGKWIPDAWASEDIKFQDAHNAWDYNLMNMEGKTVPKTSSAYKKYSRQRKKHLLWFGISWFLLTSIFTSALYIFGGSLGTWLMARLTIILKTITPNGACLDVGIEECWFSLSNLWDIISSIYLNQDYINLIGLSLLTWAVLSSLLQIIPIAKLIENLFPKKVIQFFNSVEALEIINKNRENQEEST